MIKILAALLILSTSTLVYAEYGMIPFSKEISPDLDIGKKINFGFLGKLQDEKIKIRVFPEQPPINYQMAESPEVTIEPVGEDAVKQQLQTLSKTQNLAGIIFGHIMQDLVKDMVYVIVRVYLVSEPEQYKTFGHEDAMGIKVSNVKSEVIKERFTKITGDIKQWLKAKQSPPPKSNPPTTEPVSEPPESEADASAQQQPSVEPPATKPANTEPVDDIVKRLVGTEDLLALLDGEVLPSRKPKQDQNVYREVKTLKEIYTMLYEQEHYVHPWQDEQILRDIAAEKYIGLSVLIGNLKFHSRKRIHIYCGEGFISVPIENRKGIVYKLCFEPSNLLENMRWPCSPIKMKNIEIIHRKAKQKLLALNKRSKNKDWRLPTIDELFAMTSFLPISQKNGDSLKFWSSTTKTSQREVIWGLSVQTVFVDHGRTTKIIYQTYVDELKKNKDSAFLIPVKDCPQLHNPY